MHASNLFSLLEFFSKQPSAIVSDFARRCCWAVWARTSTFGEQLLEGVHLLVIKIQPKINLIQRSLQKTRLSEFLEVLG